MSDTNRLNVVSFCPILSAPALAHGGTRGAALRVVQCLQDGQNLLCAFRANGLCPAPVADAAPAGPPR